MKSGGILDILRVFLLKQLFHSLKYLSGLFYWNHKLKAYRNSNTSSIINFVDFFFHQCLTHWSLHKTWKCLMHCGLSNDCGFKISIISLRNRKKSWKLKRSRDVNRRNGWNWRNCDKRRKRKGLFSPCMNTWKILGMLVVYWPVTIKFRICEQSSKPQTNYRCCLWFRYLTP